MLSELKFWHARYNPSFYKLMKGSVFESGEDLALTTNK